MGQCDPLHLQIYTGVSTDATQIVDNNYQSKAVQQILL
jgi:hypothetical protein